ncbi:MAG: Ribosomal large subunit pseudouridine synthase B [Anaerolineales bacterium]|nr:Ribosomal large subunit pseudouridine synthase B [Anaerolineales bacterium]
MQERLQKILAKAGYGSRRACEELLLAGRVRVNGQLAGLGQKADPALDRITLDGKALPKPEALTYIALHKPRFVLSTVEAEQDDNRETVLDLVEVRERVYPVGRLDLESEGLVLLTNDGDLANRLTHPRYGHKKEYRVLVAKRPDDAQIAAWRRGVILEDGYQTAPADVRVTEVQGKGAWMRVVMGEGRKRQIREIAAQLGLPVVRIVRLRIGSLRLGRLKVREWRFLTKEEVDLLKNPEKEQATRTPRPVAGRRPSSNRRPFKSKTKRPAR